MDKITTIRTTIDSIDKQIMTLLEKRFTLVEEIGEFKKATQQSITDTSREATIYTQCQTFRYPNEIKGVYKTIITNSKNLQRKD